MNKFSTYVLYLALSILVTVGTGQVMKLTNNITKPQAYELNIGITTPAGTWEPAAYTLLTKLPENHGTVEINFLNKLKEISHNSNYGVYKIEATRLGRGLLFADCIEGHMANFNPEITNKSSF